MRQDAVGIALIGAQLAAAFPMPVARGVLLRMAREANGDVRRLMGRLALHRFANR